jgi:RHS repeat-associated protein
MTTLEIFCNAVDGNNVITSYVYNDSESLLTDIQYPATTSLNVHFTYDGYGRRSGMTDGTGSQSYSYGNLDELLSTTTTFTGLSTKAISYSYYSNGSRESMTTPAGTFAYSYDAAGRPASMTNPFNETTTWGYQNNNWLQTQTLDNGAVATYTYNPLGQVTRLLNQIGTTISDFSGVGYDGLGNRNSVTASIPGATALDGTTAYTFDNKNQLTHETSTRNGGFTDNFGYDAAGNPTTFKGVTKSYNSNNQQTGSGFTYDSNGNPTTYGGTTVTFDPENRMTAYGNLITAGYTGDGLRGWKENSTARRYFLYDGDLPIIEINSSGSVTATNTFGANGLTSRVEGGTSVFYNFDSEGSVTQQSDGDGSVISNHFFDAYGAAMSGSLSNPFGYKAQFGYYTDTETGLQLLTHRYYDVSSGRFLTRDPISYDGGINVYAYSRNNPTNLIDPDGLDVLVIEQGPTVGNPIGHTALAITGRGVFSFGNGDAEPIKMSTDNKQNIMGGDLALYLWRETARRNTRLYIIKTTPDQDAAIERRLREIAANEPRLVQDWHLAFDNCSSRSNRGLDAGGIFPSLGIDIMGGGTSETANRLPGSAGLRASRGFIPPTLIPQGAKWQPTLIKDFILKK